MTAPHEDELRFLSELPPPADNRRGGKDSRYDALAANVGQWVEYWGKSDSVYKASRVDRAGVRFEGVIRNGTPYVRAVKV